MSLKNTLKFIPRKLRDRDLNIKFTEILDYVLDKHLTELQDVEYKFRQPDKVTKAVVKEILAEEGFGYIGELLDISQDIDHNAILFFSGLIALLKGHREGFELVLNLLNISFELEEWWEQNPKGLADTVSLKIDIDESGIINFFETFQKFKVFVKNYIYPVLEPLEFTISYDILRRNFMVAGFFDKDVFSSVPTATLSTHVAGFFDREALGLIT